MCLFEIQYDFKSLCIWVSQYSTITELIAGFAKILMFLTTLGKISQQATPLLACCVFFPMWTRTINLVGQPTSQSIASAAQKSLPCATHTSCRCASYATAVWGMPRPSFCSGTSSHASLLGGTLPSSLLNRGLNWNISITKTSRTISDGL